MYDIQQEIVPIAHDDFFVILNHPNAKFPQTDQTACGNFVL